MSFRLKISNETLHTDVLTNTIISNWLMGDVRQKENEEEENGLNVQGDISHFGISIFSSLIDREKW